MNASAHRANAREALRGNWVAAVLVAFIGSLVTGGNSSSVNFNLDLNWNSTTNLEGQTSALVPEYMKVILQDWLGLMIGTVIIIALVLLCIQLLLGGTVQLGVCRYNLNLIDRKQAAVDDILTGFSRFSQALAMNLISVALIVLGTVCLIVPGIILAYAFAMAPYILLEDPNCTGWESLKRSYNMMKGYKWKLFCLGFSFIGWSILASFTFGIGGLFLHPYVNAANASFYRNLQNQGYAAMEDL